MHKISSKLPQSLVRWLYNERTLAVLVYSGFPRFARLGNISRWKGENLEKSSALFAALRRSHVFSKFPIFRMKNMNGTVYK